MSILENAPRTLSATLSNASSAVFLRDISFEPAQYVRNLQCRMSH